MWSTLISAPFGKKTTTTTKFQLCFYLLDFDWFYWLNKCRIGVFNKCKTEANLQFKKKWIQNYTKCVIECDNFQTKRKRLQNPVIFCFPTYSFLTRVAMHYLFNCCHCYCFFNFFLSNDSFVQLVFMDVQKRNTKTFVVLAKHLLHSPR